MKPLAASKRRLASALEPRARALLSLWLLERVVLAARSANAVGEVAVLGGDRTVTALCAEADVCWKPDPMGDLNRALDFALLDSRSSGWISMLFLAGDLPALTSDDVDSLAGALEGTDLVLAPGARGGTNAIHVRTAANFSFALGGESFRRHRDQAGRANLTWRSYESPSIEADLDTPADLADLERTIPDLWRLVTRLERFLPASPT